MSTDTRSLDADIIQFPGISEDVTSPCECSHGDGPDSWCGAHATARVSVTCVAEGCNCSAGVYLLCAKCLSVWKGRAARDGIRLRVRPL